MKKLISLLLTLVMAASLTVPAAAAEDAAASTMRLESTEGAVTVKNASGLDVKLQSKLRLYDGYTVKTGSASYAYISLDGAKTLKLDASSEASVSKSGKKLEIALVSGSLFFNVSKPLESSESLNIRTSTMVTGVRGTSACVSAPRRDHSEITLLTGQLEVTGRDSLSGEMETVNMTAGERVVVAQEAVGTTQERLDIQKLSAKEQELPGFAAVEVAKDPELQSKIAEETALDLPQIIANAEERLAADQAAAREKEAEVRQQQEPQTQSQAVDPVFRTESGGDDDDDGGSAGTRPPDPPVQPDPPPAPEDPDLGSVTLNDPTAQELADALASTVGAVNVYLTRELIQNIPVDGAEKTLTLYTGTLTNTRTMILRGAANTMSDAALVNQGTLTAIGSLSVNGPLTNSGILHVGAEGQPCTMAVIGPYSGSGLVSLSDGSTLSMNGTENSLSVTVGSGGTIAFPAWETLSMLVDGAALAPAGGKLSYTNDTASAVVVQVQLTEPTPTCAVTIQGEDRSFVGQSDLGGAFMPNTPVNVPLGETFVFSLLPSKGYIIEGLSFNGSPLTANAAGEYSVGPVTGDMTVTVATKRFYAVFFDDTTARGYTVEISKETVCAEDAVTVTVTRDASYGGELDTSGLRLCVNGNGPVDGVSQAIGYRYNGYDQTSPNNAGPYVFTFSVADHINDADFDSDVGMRLTLAGVNWTFDNTTTTTDGDILAAALADPATETVRVGAWNAAGAGIDCDMTVQAHQQLYLDVDTAISTGGVLTVEEDGKVYVKSGVNFSMSGDAALNLSGAMQVSDAADRSATTFSLGASAGDTSAVTISKTGSLNISYGCTLVNNGTITNSGTLFFDPESTLANYGALTNNNELSSNAALNFDGGTLTNNGTLLSCVTLNLNSGTPINNGILTVSSGSEMVNNCWLNINSGTLEVDGSLKNTGSVSISTDGEVTVDGTLELYGGGSLTVDGALTVNSGGSLKIGGSVSSSSPCSLGVSAGGALTNGGTLTIDSGSGGYSGGSLNVQDGGTLTNTGTLTIGGTADVSGQFLVGNGSTINVSGTLTLRTNMEDASGGALGGIQPITLENGATLRVRSNLTQPTFSDEDNDKIQPGGDPGDSEFLDHVNQSGSSAVANMKLEAVAAPPAP